MLNNQNLKKKHIDYIPYELQVGIFNTNCKNCPYSAYRIRKKTGLTLTFRNYREAIRYATDNRAPLNRLCTFNDEIFTLTEIVHNHCMFWDSHPIDLKESSEVTEITETEITQLKFRLYSLESFVKLKK